ncbi:hypothetical protein GCM10023210_44460 [Chryseobacterium ginsengisoli]|uniref:Uncharacterized protein n=1 Tax=Chryseobacterium ginsengisoli TaxID=363853 RepID=A0ABP9MVX5_9FLAO
MYGYMDNATATDEANQLAMPDLNAYNYIKGYMHTHPNDYYYTNADGFTIPKIGIKIFSPTDAIYFMKMLKNAKFTGKPLGGVYGVMVASMNNYQIRFTGTSAQIKEFTLEQQLQLDDDFADYMKNKLDTSKKLELGFLYFLETKMNIAGVNLYRMNANGTTTEIHLNVDKTDTVENNCPI